MNKRTPTIKLKNTTTRIRVSKALTDFCCYCLQLVCFLQFNIKPGKSMKVRKKTSGRTSERLRPASLGGGGDAQSFNPQKVMPRRPIRTPCPFFFPVPFLHAEWPIAGSADEAVPTSCQISPFIVRKHPCNGPYPVFSAQVKKQQIRVENANCLGFSHYALRPLPSSPTSS